MKRRGYVPALLALVLTSCPGCYANQCLPGEVRVIESRDIPELATALTGMPVRAVTLGRDIFVHPESAEDTVLLKHERRHVAQYDSAGVWFFVQYSVETLRKGYVANRFEIAADRAALATDGTH